MGPSLFESGTISVNPRLYEEEGFAHWDMDTTMFMGLTAEKLHQQTGFSREDLDRWALRSHQYAAKAQGEGFFAGEILPLPAKDPDGKEFMVDRDQAVRAQTHPGGFEQAQTGVQRGRRHHRRELLAPQRRGASAMVLMSRQAAQARGVRPLAAVRSVGFVGVDPTLMGEGPVPASRMALDKAGLKVEDIDFWEINEAFLHRGPQLH